MPRRPRSIVTLAAITLVMVACSSTDNPTTTSAPAPSASATPAEPPHPTAAPTPTALPTARATQPPTATPTPARLPPAQLSQTPIEWVECGTVQCGRLTVPVDHDAPTDGSLELALARAPARSAEGRIGALLVNPGGPGASGVAFLAPFVEALPVELRDRFDVVSWDPRGVGDSSGLRCADEPAEDINEVADTRDGIRDELDTYVEDIRSLGVECLVREPVLLEHVGTVATVRDLDAIRAALGDEKLTYLGFSYGTRIGAVYATLFPTAVRAMVLDGAFPPGLSSTELALKAADLDTVLLRIDQACGLEASCPVADPGLLATFNELRDTLGTEPTGAPLGLSDRSALIGATLFALYVPSSWDLYAEALHESSNDDMATMYRIAEAWYGDGTGSFDDIFLGANTAIMCADQAYATDLTETTADAEAALQASPLLGDLLFGNNCAAWPVAGEPLPPIDSTGAPRLMVVGGAHDPATPLRWAERLSVDLANSFLLSYLGEGHTAVASGNGCVDRIAIAYLVELQSPPGDVSCHQESGTLGVRVHSIDTGLLIDEVVPESAASGILAPGEVIVRIAGAAATTDSLTTHADQETELEVLSGDGSTRTVILTADRLPWTLPPD